MCGRGWTHMTVKGGILVSAGALVDDSVLPNVIISDQDCHILVEEHHNTNEQRHPQLTKYGHHHEQLQECEAENYKCYRKTDNAT